MHRNITRRRGARWKVLVGGSSVIRVRRGLDGISVSLPLEDECRAGLFVFRGGDLSHRFQLLVFSRRGWNGFLLLGQGGQIPSLLSVQHIVCMRKKTKKNLENVHMQDSVSRSKGKGDTNVRLEACRVVLVLYQFGSVKHCLEVGEEVIHLSFSWG